MSLVPVEIVPINTKASLSRHYHNTKAQGEQNPFMFLADLKLTVLQGTLLAKKEKGERAL